MIILLLWFFKTFLGFIIYVLKYYYVFCKTIGLKKFFKCTYLFKTLNKKNWKWIYFFVLKKNPFAINYLTCIYVMLFFFSWNTFIYLFIIMMIICRVVISVIMFTCMLLFVFAMFLFVLVLLLFLFLFYYTCTVK